MTEPLHWQPAANPAMLAARAALNQQLRSFLAVRGVLEVKHRCSVTPAALIPTCMRLLLHTSHFHRRSRKPVICKPRLNSP